MKTDFSGFHKLTVKERLQKIKEFANLTEEETEALQKYGALSKKTADLMIENVFTTMQMPLGIATNFVIDGKEKIIPMALEEPSVIAAASKAAKLAMPHGFITDIDEPVMRGQIQIVEVNDIEKAIQKINKNKEQIIEKANSRDSVLVKLGGGCKDIETKLLKTEKGSMLIVNLIVDVRDAMGANAVNTMAELVSPMLEEMSGGKTRLKIISNLADMRLARARCIWKKEALGGEDIVDKIIDAWLFAKHDKYRCATHNKGIMNGIDAVTIATGNDFRAIEAGAHSYAAINGYRPLTQYEKTKEGDLLGKIELPIASGIIGGAINTNPISKISLKILDVKSAKELAGIMVSVGLAQNFAALYAMVTKGIQHGHMKLHAKNIAIVAGAEDEQIEKIASQLIDENNINVSRAKEILNKS